MIIRNEALLERCRNNYTAAQIRDLRQFLTAKGTFDFPAFKNGIFPAAGFDRRKFASTGYQNAWVRDNFYIAWGHYVIGKPDVAVKNALSLAAFFKGQRPRFLAIINGKIDPHVAMNRPHIRFNGRTRKELRSQWSHAQNDALGYFVWFYSRLILDRHLPLNSDNIELLTLFTRYFEAIRFWRDEDNGHWEEKRKKEASSIGVVVAALKMFRRVLARVREEGSDGLLKLAPPRMIKSIDKLIAHGLRALHRILPAECVDSTNARRYDAALLFLIWPMEIVEGKMADRILRDVSNRLEGDYGIRRYLGDSYWAANYKERLAADNRHIAETSDTAVRDAFFQDAAEAQWCIFDPIVSVIYGNRYAQTGRRADLQKQIRHLNRSLGQLTGPRDAAGPFRCPELYCLQKGLFLPNDHTPLLWTQANLMMALKVMEDSVTPSSFPSLSSTNPAR